jgi:parallel beta-helix repeat protein
MLMIECTSNTLSENFVMDNEYGIVVGDSSGNSIYSNYFINVTQQVLDTELGAGMPSENRWDNGKEGNYWSNYAGTDADDDGLGDSPYVLYEDNQDNYPLMDYPSSSSFVATGRPEPTESSSAALPLPTEVLIGIIVAAVVIAAVAMIKLRKN